MRAAERVVPGQPVHHPRGFVQQHTEGLGDLLALTTLHLGHNRALALFPPTCGTLTALHLVRVARRRATRLDLVVLDPETVVAAELRLEHDLPGDSPRLMAAPIGIERVYVNGTLAVVDGASTGALAGTVLRSGTHTETVPIPADA